MFAGCLPVLVQWPFLTVLYLLFRSPVIGGQPNQLLTHDLLGAPLSSHWLAGGGPFSAQGAVFAGLFAAAGRDRLGHGQAGPADRANASAGDLGRGRGPLVRSQRRDPDHAVPDRDLRGVPAARGRAVPGHYHRLDARRASCPAPAQPPVGARPSRPGATRPSARHQAI